MAYDGALAQRLRDAFHGQTGITEKKMFGGLSFMLRGYMCCGVIGENLVVRVGAEQFEDALSLPHARPMDFTGRPMKGFVYVGPSGLDSDDALKEWVNRGVTFVHTLPPK